MEKRYELGLIATGLLTIIARYLPIKIPAKAEEKIERLEKSFANPELVDCYKKQLGLEKKEKEMKLMFVVMVATKPAIIFPYIILPMRFERCLGAFPVNASSPEI